MYNTTTGNQLYEIDVSSAGNLGNIAVDMSSHKFYGQYWDGSAEIFVQIQLDGTIKKLSEINLKFKMSGTRTIDYQEKIFYLVTEDNVLLGLDLEDGSEKIRKPLSTTMANSGFFYDGATKSLLTMCRPDKGSFSFAVCRLTPADGKLVAVGDERIASLLMGEYAFDSANQLMFAPSTGSGVDVYDTMTGKKIVTGVMSRSPFAMASNPKCECCLISKKTTSDNEKETTGDSDRRRRLGYGSCANNGGDGTGVSPSSDPETNGVESPSSDPKTSGSAGTGVSLAAIAILICFTFCVEN